MENGEATIVNSLKTVDNPKHIIRILPNIFLPSIIPKYWKQLIQQMLVYQCLSQHYSKCLRSGNNPEIHHELDNTVLTYVPCFYIVAWVYLHSGMVIYPKKKKVKFGCSCRYESWVKAYMNKYYMFLQHCSGS